MAKHRELALGDVERLLLERVDRPVDFEEADEVPRRADRQRPEGVAFVRPLAEGLFPGQVEQRRGGAAKAEARERGREGWFGQMRFRRYVVTLAS
ncbi:MAG TPA: hypothetical protein VFU17_05435 [Candidatus Limnocylindrales bacterium]|nr:hypothetical protein [Candidatus Limnocylindrales bacterium]